MDAGKRSSSALLERTTKSIEQLITRYMKVVSYAPIEGKDKVTTAAESYQIEVETTALIKAAEDVMSMTREMKEMWLFGQIEVDDAAEEPKGTNGDAQVVARALLEAVKEHEKSLDS